MQCPKCKIELKDEMHGGTLYHKCPRCEGFWFDPGELSRIRQEKDWFTIDHVHKAAKATIADTNLKCPRHEINLKTIEYEQETGIKVHVCPRCEGLWLEAGEVRAIHKANETWFEKLRDKLDEELTAIELFLIKIGPNIPK